MSKITPKNLHYDDTLPPFLQRLRASNNNLNDRHEFTVSRAKKPRTEDELAEDEPVYFNEESGETLTRGEWETREAEGEKFSNADKGAEESVEGEEVKKKQEVEVEAKREKVADIGVGRKRKAGKLVGGGGEGEDDLDTAYIAAIKVRESTELGKAIAAARDGAKGDNKQEAGKGEKIRAKAKKVKKVKLSFDDDD